MILSPDRKRKASATPVHPQGATPPPPSWLDHWPAARRSTLAQFFFAGVRTGLSSPPEVVAHVAETLTRQLAWSIDTDKRAVWCAVLASLQDDPQAAEQYAAEVVAIERLSPEAKAARKAEQAKQAVLAHMRGKETTQKQHWLLRSLGHTGELPTDRAAASELIDRLLRERKL